MKPRSRMQMSVAGLLAVVACVALNVWLFRVGFLWGLVGLNLTKHVAIAWLCEACGVNRRISESERAQPVPAMRPHVSPAES